MDDYRFEIGTALSRPGIVHEYGSKHKFRGIVSKNVLDDYYCIPEERVEKNEAILVGRMENLGSQITGAIQFGSSSGRHVLVETFGQRHWEKEENVKPISTSRRRFQPMRDLSISVETEKHRRELSLLLLGDKCSRKIAEMYVANGLRKPEDVADRMPKNERFPYRKSEKTKAEVDRLMNQGDTQGAYNLMTKKCICLK